MPKAKDNKSSHWAEKKVKKKFRRLNPFLVSLFPFLRWVEDWDSKTLQSDLIAGITVALVLIPQSLAYAQLAGLPAQYGLYAAFLPPIIAALFGSSKHLSTGPVAIVSLMTATAIGSLAVTSSPEFIIYTTLLALGLGLFQLGLGILRLGSLVSFISHPVIYGFTNAAAIIIATTQLSKFFGVTVDSYERHYETILAVIREAMHHTHAPTLIMGTVALLVMYAFKKINPRIPYVLIVVVVATLISWQMGYRVTYKGSAFNIRSEQFLAEITNYNDLSVQIGSTQNEMQKYKEQLDSGLLGERQQLEIDGMYRLLNFEYIQLSEERKLLAKELRRTPLYDINPAAKSFVLAQEVNGTLINKDVWNVRMSEEMFNFNDLEFVQGGATVGVIPQGLPAFAIPQIDVSKLISLFPVIVIITIIAFTEAMSVAQAIAIKTKQSIDPNQELIGQGLANILGSFNQSFPVAGSFSRTAVNYQSGGVTGISSVVTGAMVLLTLLFLTPLLIHLPQVILAAIITISVFSLINFGKIANIFKTSRQDGVVAIVTFVTTLYFAPDLEKGVAFGIILSLAYYLFHNARPRLVFLSKYRDGTFHDAKLFHLARCENVAVVRFDAPLFFANAENLEHAVIRDLAQHKKISAILIVASGMNDLDTTGVEILQELIATLRQSKRDIYFAGVKSQVYEVMEASGLIDEIGKDHIFNSQKRAVQHIVKQLKRHDDAEKCPLVRYVKMYKEDAQYSHNMSSVSDYFNEIIFGRKRLRKRV